MKVDFLTDSGLLAAVPFGHLDLAPDQQQVIEDDEIVETLARRQAQMQASKQAAQQGKEQASQGSESRSSSRSLLITLLIIVIIGRSTELDVKDFARFGATVDVPDMVASSRQDRR